MRDSNLNDTELLSGKTSEESRQIKMTTEGQSSLFVVPIVPSDSLGENLEDRVWLTIKFLELPQMPFEEDENEEVEKKA